MNLNGSLDGNGYTLYGLRVKTERPDEFGHVRQHAVAQKHNALTPDFFADMSMAFISDKDAVENRAMIYYECIAQK